MVKVKTDNSVLFNKINIYSWINLFSKLIVPVLILPLLFKKYSQNQSEDWLYFLNIMSMAVFFDFGTLSLQNRLYGYIKGKVGISSEVFNSKFNSILLISSFFWLSALLCYFYSVRGGVSILIALGLIANYVVVYVQNIIFAQNYIVKSKNIETIFNFLRLFYTLCLINANVSFDFLLQSYYSFYIFIAIAYLFLLKRVCPHYLFALSNPWNLLVKYKSQILSAWVATSFSVGVFSMSNVFLVDRYPAYAWGNYLFTMRVVDMIANIAFVPFYSRIPEFVNQYFRNEKQTLRAKISKNLMLSVALYVIMSLTCIIGVDFLLSLFNANTKFTSTDNVILIFCSMLFYKVGTSFLQISAFGNKVQWHKPIIIQFAIIVIAFLLIKFDTPEFNFSLPFAISLLVFLPYSFLLAKKNY